MRRLGTKYGGWSFIDHPRLQGSHILSCGLGEDASFDVEFAAAYDARVVIADPTPRAIAHYSQIMSRVGLGRTRDYSGSGNEPVQAYDLSRVFREQLVLIESAVAERSGTMRFFAPPNPDHVSYSLVNFQNDYVKDTPYIEVSAITFLELAENVDLDRLHLVKFDIEGAEVTVIPQMLDAGIKPSQVLVEFDELNLASKHGVDNYRRCDQLLKESGYLVAFFEAPADFLYVHHSMYRGR